MSMTPASSKYFQQVAGEWDALRSGYFGEEVRLAAFAKAYLRQDMTVADIGGGTGFMAAGLAPQVAKVHLLDGSAAMLETARKNLAQFANIEYHLADGQALPVADGGIDVAFANMYLHHCPDPQAAIREMVRLLKPGGRLVITDLDAHRYSWMREEMADVWLGFDRQVMRDWLQEAGLVNVIVDCTGQSCCAASSNTPAGVENQRQANISVFVATGTRRISMRDQVKAAYSAVAQGTGCGCGKSEVDEPLAAQTNAGSSCCSKSESQASASATTSSCCSSSAQPQQATGQAGCCAPAPDAVSSPFYSNEELAAAPQEAGEISLGCGNPVALANLKPGETVLDIGSGGGIDSFLAARKVGANGKVIGVDMTPAMLERARRSAHKAGIANVEFRQGQAEALPVEDGSVDVILSNCVINLTEDKGQVFGEAYRALRPGGRLEVSDIVTDREMSPEVRHDAGEWAGCVSGALPEQEYLDLIAQAGFKDVTVQRSATSEEFSGVKVYSAIVSARKMGDSKPETDVVRRRSSGCC